MIIRRGTGSATARPPLLSLKILPRVFIVVALLLALQSFILTSKLYIDHNDVHAPPSLSSSEQLHPQLPSTRPFEVSPDGTVTFTPDEFQAGNHENYINLPNNAYLNQKQVNDAIQKLMNEEEVSPPAERLLHEAPTPPSSNAIVGLASYPKFMDGWLHFVGSLRVNGYEGHIIVGVNPNIPQEERNYLDKMGVTYYAVELANCTSHILEGVSTTDNAVRAKCSKGMEDLKLEWGRYEMARRWLRACKTCTGWSMVIDTRDIFFQSDPFKSLGDANTAQYELQFIEEIASYTNTMPETPHRAVNIGQSERYKIHVHPCYGQANVKAYELINRPMLCSGTVIGTSNGIHRFLSVLVHEFHTNNNKGLSECKSPSTTDQWTMNYLYYRGQFGYIDKTKTWPWGTGPVLTVGKPCVDSSISSHHGGAGQIDMMQFDPNSNLILNPHEVERSGSKTRVAPTLHQWDRCTKWIKPWFRKHKELYMMTDDRPVRWVTE